MARWFTLLEADGEARAHAALPELPIENVELCELLLSVAREQVLDFAADDEPAVQVADLLENLGVEEGRIAAVLTLLDLEAAPTAIPDRYAFAQLQQAKNLWLAGKGEDGPDGFAYSPRPLTKDIQRIIRPTSGVPDVF
ncbi:hypothetical protein [Microbacterium dauci]|uniref:Uncharacterized protein n=1 Tax=Microbacterium dauci TaxID=3048008 RepID=A0ABT6ZGW3_9MICO|nr:hypothetical protein [Microbacterium sp. LX3-4]MDJ1115389.1 hypothetical protein [Microbacterium sp. LX3-4]